MSNPSATTVATKKLSLCPALPATRVTAIERGGGHHFGGDYDALVRLIVGKLPAALG